MDALPVIKSDKSVTTTNRVNPVEPYVKITLSPNTPSPEPEQESDVELPGVVQAEEHAHDETFVVPMGEIENNMIGEEWEGFKDVPICVDFGIQDYLCQGQEGEFDVSSDTDTSYLGATPPHRFSDGEIDPIEAMPVLLDTELNLSSSSRRSHDRAIVPSGQIPLSCSLNETPKFFSDLSENPFFRRVAPGALRAVLDERTATVVPPRPFRRNISLPAAIFKTFLVEQPGSVGQSGESSQAGKVVCIGTVAPSCPEPTPTAIVHLGTIDSISTSSQVNFFEGDEQERSENNGASGESYSMNEKGLESTWISGDSLDSESNDVENQAFTSELEKRSLIIRHMRRLIRQDTTGNFAPPDFHI